MSEQVEEDTVEIDLPTALVKLGAETWVDLATLSVAQTNFFGTDIKRDAKFEAMVERARANPADMSTLLVRSDRASNQLQIISDPIGYLAICEALGADAAVKVRTQQVGGTDADVSVYMYAEAEQHRPLRNMRRARALHHLQHVALLTRVEIARHCGLSESAVCRDITAAELEMAMPHFAAILRTPSDAPAAYYRSIRAFTEKAENIESLEALHNRAAELVAKGERYPASKALIALGVANITTNSKLVRTKSITLPVVGIEGWLEVDGTVDYRLIFSFQSEPEMLENLARDVEAHILRAGGKSVALCAVMRARSPNKTADWACIDQCANGAVLTWTGAKTRSSASRKCSAAPACHGRQYTKRGVARHFPNQLNWGSALRAGICQTSKLGSPTRVELQTLFVR